MDEKAFEDSNNSAVLTVVKQMTSAMEEKALLEMSKEIEIAALNRRTEKSGASRSEADLIKIIDRYIFKEMDLDEICSRSMKLIMAWGRGDSVILEKLRM
jgi:hypothetical protein